MPPFPPEPIDTIQGSPNGYPVPVSVNYAASTPPNYTDRSGTITAATTSQTVANANPTRVYLFFQNPSDTGMFINFGANAAANANSIYIPAGGYYEPLKPPGQSVTVFCNSNAKAFSCKEG